MAEEFLLNDDLLKEVFALTSASTDYEVKLALDEKSEDFWKNEKLDETYKLAQAKREYALDSLRGVFSYLRHHDYQLRLEGKDVDLTAFFHELIQESEEESEEEKSEEQQSDVQS